MANNGEYSVTLILEFIQFTTIFFFKITLTPSGNVVPRVKCNQNMRILNWLLWIVIQKQKLQS